MQRTAYIVLSRIASLQRGPCPAELRDLHTTVKVNKMERREGSLLLSRASNPDPCFSRANSLLACMIRKLP